VDQPFVSELPSGRENTIVKTNAITLGRLYDIRCANMTGRSRIEIGRRGILDRVGSWKLAENGGVIVLAARRVHPR
jgi:hypothetical protein